MNKENPLTRLPGEWADHNPILATIVLTGIIICLLVAIYV